MTEIKINEQIAFLRKQKGITQEEMARALGVTNQAVSKWELGQCCPDIGLLPDIAKMFEVSVDELLGYTPASTSENIILDIRKRIDSLPEGEDFDFAFRTAAALHTVIVSKFMTEGNPGWDTDQAIEHAVEAEWGYSCCSMTNVSTAMSVGAVFFSNNKSSCLNSSDIRRIAAILRVFSDTVNLKIASALYCLTYHAEDAYADSEIISEESGIALEKVENCLNNALSYFIQRKDSEKLEVRFAGSHMSILPILSLLHYSR